MAENIKYLCDSLEAEKTAIRQYKPEVLEIPKYISDNLKYEFFDWQKSAFENLLITEEEQHKQNPTHLMFNMATGTGKTLLMASTLLYYYKQGYRHFIFFVNQNNIVDKTENNFIDNTHNKYLFKDNIVIDDAIVNIKKVDVFSDNPQSIEIKFTTIQKLYNDIHLEKENQTTLDDLQRKNIVMFADEAHHLNANTKIKKGEQINLNLSTELKNNTNKKEVEHRGWERTVIELILNKDNKTKNNKNVLLEFTATIPENEQVAKKYEDKMVYRFDLKSFLQAGYTKEINLISSTLNKKQRILQALVFNWYRHKIALKNDIANFKSVILFRSKIIDDSKKDYDDFCIWIDEVSTDDFGFLGDIAKNITQSKKIYEQGQSRTSDILMFIKNNDIKYQEIADWIKANFQAKNIIITNSKSGTKTKEKTTKEQEKLLNNLEDKGNNIRAIFTVKRLTEGWDVLNLFDIVRLDETQNTGGTTDKKGKVPEATTQEKQLIGRGVRYYPFAYNNKIKNKRKFDNDTKHELRILEELYYYAYDEDAKYISHLSKELKKDGYITDDKEVKEFAIKPEFKESDFYKNIKVWCNERIDNPNRQETTLKNIENTFKYKVPILNLKHREVNFDGTDDKKENSEQEQQETSIKIKEFDRHIFNKAISKAQKSNSLFSFENLKKELKIESIDDLLKNNFLGDFSISFLHSVDIEITNQNKLDALLKFLKRIFADLKQYSNPSIGSEFVAKNFAKLFDKPKTKYIDTSALDDDIANNDWYVLDSFAGNSYEKGLIEFIKERIGNLKKAYKEVYLLRNEEVYKIYDFKKGRGFQPDFILFLKGDENLYYQIFIEPKGENIADGDKWKEDFLLEISNKYGLKNILKEENKNYRLIGLPFFMPDNTKNFEIEFKQILPN
jgi:type III restriction enzyme